MIGYGVTNALRYMMPNTRNFLMLAVGFAIGYIANRVSNFVQTRLQNLSTYFWPSQPIVSARVHVQEKVEKRDFAPQRETFADYSIEPIELGNLVKEQLVHPRESSRDTYEDLLLQQASTHPAIDQQQTVAAVEAEQVEVVKDDQYYDNRIAEQEAEEASNNELYASYFAAQEAEMEMSLLLEVNTEEAENT
jgi:hypothetical protein